MADSTTPNIAQANEAASPVNPLLERARNRIAARRDLETSDTSPSSERMGLPSLSLAKSSDALANRIVAPDSTTRPTAAASRASVRYRRRRLSSISTPISSAPASNARPELSVILAPTNDSSIPLPPQKKAPRPLPKRTMSTSASMDLNKENLSSHAIPKDQLKTTKTEVKPIEIDDVIALAENKELDLMNTYVNLEKWIPMWQAVQLNGNQALFYPEDINLKKRKEYLFNGQPMRDLEAEGFFVSDGIDRTNWNLNKMERRLAMAERGSKELHWFGPDLRMTIDPIPISPAAVRNQIEVPSFLGDEENERLESQQLEPYSEIELLKPFKNSIFRRVMDSPDGTYEMIINVDSIQITDHPLLCEELKIANDIESLIDNWKERKRSKIVDYLSNKLKSLKESYDLSGKSPVALSAEPSPTNLSTLSKPVHSPFYARQSNRVDARRNKLVTEDQEKRRTQLKEIHATRLLRDAEMKMDRLLEYKILKAWNDLKKERKVNGFASTKLHVHVKIKEMSADEDHSVLEREIIDELKELEEIHQFEELHHQRVFQNRLEDWTRKHETCEKIKAEQKRVYEEEKAKSPFGITGLPSKNKLQRQDLSSLASLDVLRSERDLAIPRKSKNEIPELPWVGNVFEEPQPEMAPPRPFKEEHAKMNIQKRIDSSYRPAGAPLLSFSHSYDSALSETAQCPRPEQLRRREVDATYVYLKIFYNDKEVTKTSAFPLDPHRFVVFFNDKSERVIIDDSGRAINNQGVYVELKVSEIPESIRMEVYETRILGDSFVGEIVVPIPRVHDVIGSVDRDSTELDFSGRPFSKNGKVASEASPESWCTGKIKLLCAWGVDASGRSLGPKRSRASNGASLHRLDPLLRSGPAGLLNLSNLLDWISELKVDPNDPRNAEIVTLKQVIHSVYSDSNLDATTLHEYWTSRTFFRLNMPIWLKKMTLGVGTSSDLSKLRRIQLFQARHEKRLAPRDIPLLEQDVRDSDLKPRKHDPSNLAATSSSETVGFIKRIRYHQLINRARLAVPPKIDDYVREERIPEAAPQKNLFDILFPIYRPLNPSRVERKTLASTSPENCKLIIQVLRGFNLPTRIVDLRQKESLSHADVDPNVTRTFVEASFQRNRVRTAAKEGVSPQWNEMLSLDVLTPNGDLSPKSLLDADIGMESVFLNLFDEKLINMADKRDKDAESIVHHRKERNWLGSMSIPFSTVWERVKIDGIFHVKIPVLSLGYEKGTSALAAEVPSIAGIVSSGETLLHIFITLDPPLAQPAAMKLKFQTEESEKFLRYCKLYTSQVESFRRVVSTTTIDINGCTTFIARFIRPQKPPTSLDSVQQLVRYVSMIPVIPNRTAFAADCNIWCTSDQLLEIGAGDMIEHAILLCNFLSYKEHDAYVVLGRGIPDGLVAYVLLRDNSAASSTSLTNIKMEPEGIAKDKSLPQKYLLFNPSTGETYRIQDTHIPLKEIGCVFNSENIWSNVQKFADIQRINLHFQEPSSWKPIFTAKYPKPELKSVQRENLVYSEFPDRYLSDLESSIEKSIVENIESWRVGKITRWNKLCSRSFKLILQRLENETLSGIPISSTLQESKELVSLRTVYSMSGFPMNSSYTDLNALLTMVHNTDIHTKADKGIEFALAVHCVGYPGKFVSVWIYLASLNKAF